MRALDILHDVENRIVEAISTQKEPALARAVAQYAVGLMLRGNLEVRQHNIGYAIRNLCPEHWCEPCERLRADPECQHRLSVGRRQVPMFDFQLPTPLDRALAAAALLSPADRAALMASIAVDLPGPCPPRPMRDVAEQEACFKLPDGVEPCPAIWGDVSQQVWCTRGTEHEGDHVVGGKDGMVRARWPQGTST